MTMTLSKARLGKKTTRNTVQPDSTGINRISGISLSPKR